MRCGLVVALDKGQRVRPFREWREIRRGRNKGRVEIVLPNGRPRRMVVEKENVRRWPGKEG